MLAEAAIDAGRKEWRVSDHKEIAKPLRHTPPSPTHIRRSSSMCQPRAHNHAAIRCTSRRAMRLRDRRARADAPRLTLDHRERGV